MVAAAAATSSSMQWVRSRLPAGWIAEPYHTPSRYVVVTAPSAMGMLSATIDWRDRGFRGGLVISGRFESERSTRFGRTRKRYRGRGWQEQLLKDAVRWLRKVERS